MSADQALNEAVKTVIAYSLQVELPLQDVICRGDGESLKVTFLFRELDSYGIVMRDTIRKDKMIEAFLRSLTANGYDFGSHPRLSFSFSVDV